VIVVDTSVWIAAMRQPLGHPASTLRGLLDADMVALALPVRIELMAGVAGKDRSRLGRALSGLPILMPTDETWRLIEGWIPSAADRGHRFAVSDLLIAGVTAEVGGLVWSLDADFERMEALGLVRCHG
jgi:predicted nucleic acid-binding protein